MKELEYGSLQNLMMGNSKSTDTIEVGTGATVVSWTDRHACTVIDVSPSGKTITIQRDNAIRTDKLGMSDAQQYKYEADPKGSIYKCRMNKKGVWKTLGCKQSVLIGRREEYYDYSF